jgi:hypothetical protein
MDYSVKSCRLTPIFSQPANPVQPAGGQKIAKVTPNMDQSVQNCRLTPILPVLKIGLARTPGLQSLWKPISGMECC